MKKRITATICLGLVGAIAWLALVHMPTQAQPGSQDDPLVSRRYVDERIATLSDEIASLRMMLIEMGTDGISLPPDAAMPPTGEPLPAADHEQIFADVIVFIEAMYGEALRTRAGVIPFDVLYVPAGSRIIFSGGSEFIMRSGVGHAITGEVGIVDVTAGRDVQDTEIISHNHLMLVPQTDGRGVLVSSGAWFMAKGAYTIVP